MDVARTGRGSGTSAARDAQPGPGDVKHHVHDDPSVQGTMEIATIAWLQIARITAAARHRVTHEPPETFSRAVALILQITGRSVIEQDGRTVRLAPGHFGVCDSSRPYTLTSPGRSQRLLLLIPHECLDEDIDLNEILLRSFSGAAGVGQLVFQIAAWVVEELASIDAKRADVLARTATEIINLAIHEKSARRPGAAARKTLLDRIQDYVADHLRDPHLSLESIARHLNASKRSLHRAVSNSNSSIHDLIWHQRLERCRRDLLDPARARQTIAEIAHSWGFKNFTHFSQAFREHFGTTAREIRRSISTCSE